MAFRLAGLTLAGAGAATLGYAWTSAEPPAHSLHISSLITTRFLRNVIAVGLTAIGAAYSYQGPCNLRRRQGHDQLQHHAVSVMANPGKVIPAASPDAWKRGAILMLLRWSHILTLHHGSETRLAISAAGCCKCVFDTPHLWMPRSCETNRASPGLARPTASVHAEVALGGGYWVQLR
jgi:hypothetical protein